MNLINNWWHVFIRFNSYNRFVLPSLLFIQCKYGAHVASNFIYIFKYNDAALFLFQDSNTDFYVDVVHMNTCLDDSVCVFHKTK